jgi:hypothetical protein
MLQPAGLIERGRECVSIRATPLMIADKAPDLIRGKSAPEAAVN